jgi:hypothetical protein
MKASQFVSMTKADHSH